MFRNPKLAGSIGGHRTHALHGSHAIARRARDGFLASFERLVDPHGQLDPADRAARAQHARAAHMKQLALRSAAARRTR